MAKNGISKAKVCSKLGWHPQTWSSKMADPKWSYVMAVCHVFGVSLVSLIGTPQETTTYIDCPYCGKPMQIKAKEVKV